MDPNATLTSLQLLYDIAETYGLDQKDVEKPSTKPLLSWRRLALPTWIFKSESG
ncbi:hypothetical protein QCA50_008435 [Cerrena zonata]|uniref:Uncharacterized protein n=1 Tax=Cerrena zonata TaxID=2478898 RepID=A0AAW0G3J5_9APHY